MPWLEPFMKVLHDSQIGNADGEIFDLDGKYSLLALQIDGVEAGATPTISFTASVDGENFTAIIGTDVGDASTQTMVTTTEGDGIYLIDVLGIRKFKAAITGFSGTTPGHAVTVTALAVAG